LIYTTRIHGSKARTGTIFTDHGEIKTPVFMPVGTAGTVKAMHNKDLEEQINARIILGNTYHLYLRPGTEIFKKSRRTCTNLMHGQRPILTDSGGYQVYSLAHRRKMNEEGVIFQSHVDGSSHTFSPEK
jgi:queuine tRNA-ribosyltransferase